MDFDIGMTDELLATTRAVRRRFDLERPVPRSVIAECLDLAVQAPTATNAQTWRWLAVDDPGQRAALAELYRSAGGDYFVKSEASARERGDAQAQRVYSAAGWLAENLQRVPVFVIACLEGRLPPNPSAGILASVYGSIFPAVWNFQLALRARGLGSTLTTLHLTHEQEAARLLGLPDSFMQVALIPVAYTKGTDFKRAARPPAATVTRWNRW
jgi:nitroreductase